jgi:copper chaperone CopZ
MHDATHNIEYFDFLKDEIEVLSDERHPAIREIETHLPSISKMEMLATSLVVEDMQNCKTALDLTTDVKALYKAIEEHRKHSIEPMRRMVQAINDCAKALQEQLNKVEFDIKIKLATFQQKEQEKARIAEEAVQKLSETLGIEICIPDTSKSVRSAKASAFFKEVNTFEIVDESLIPDEYWVVDEKKLQKHIDLGKREIPGVKIVKDKKFIVRSK